MNTKLFNGILLMLLLLGSVFIIQSSAITLDQESEDDESNETDDSSDETEETNDEDIEEAYEREVEVYADNRSLEIESALEYNNTAESFYAYFNIYEGDYPEMTLDYSTENSTTESELSYTVNFVELVEFKESGEAAGYDGNDTVLSTYDLSEALWENLVYTTTDVDGNTVHKAVATTADGIVSIILYVSGSFADVNGSQVTPNAVKIDIEIHNYDYNGSDSYLALQTDIATEAELEVESESYEEEAGLTSNEGQLSFDNTDASAFFSWMETATADGQTIDVLNSGLLTADLEDDEEDTEEQEPGVSEGIMYFTFDVQNAADIIWDPKVGIKSAGAASNLATITTSNTGDTTTGANLNNVTSDLPTISVWLATLSLFAVATIVLIKRKNP